MLDGTQPAGLGSTLPMLGILLVVVILIVYCSHMFSKYIAVSSFKTAQSKHIKIIDRVMVGQDRFLIIVAADERYFLVGVSSGQMSLLAELSKEDIEKTQAQWDTSHKTSAGFKDLLLEKWTTKLKK